MQRKTDTKGTLSDPKIIKDVVKLAKSGMTQTAIAKRFGHAQSWVGRILQLAGENERNAKKYQRRKRIAAAIEAGMSAADVCAKYQCSIGHLDHIKTEFGISLRRLNMPLICQVIADLWLRHDINHTDIATRNGIALASVQRIAAAAKAAGLPCGRKVGRPRKS